MTGAAHHLRRYGVLAAALIGLSACAGPTPPADDAQALAYSQEARTGYQALADDPPGPNGEHFQQHAFVAAGGDTFGPDTVGSRALGDTAPTAARALARLYVAFDEGARTRKPETAARAQVAFDCWIAAVEAGEEKRAQTCRDDFQAALDSLSAKAARTTVVLMADPNGGTGEADLSAGGRTETLDRGNTGVVVGDGDLKRVDVTDDELQRRYQRTFDARPQLPQTYVVTFAFGRAAFTDQGRGVMTEVVADVRNREVPEATIAGHTDTVGTDADNEALSQARAEAVRAFITAETDLPAESLEIVYFGESRPAVATPDETPEPRNRRVEVNVR